MKVWGVLLAAIALAVAFETEDDVIVGTDSNFDDILNSNTYLLVEFYAPWCGHCKSLAPEYAKAAGLLKDSPVKLVKVDATVQSKAAERFHVQGYPTLKWFKNGKDTEYTGGRTAKDIVAWVTKKSGPAATTLDTVNAATTLAEANDVVVLGFFPSATDEAALSFLSVADQLELPFGITTSNDVAAHYKVTAPKIIVLKKFDEGRVEYTGAFDADEITSFVEANQLPHVIEFSDAVAPKIFGGPVKAHLLLFGDKNNAKYSEWFAALQSVAPQYKGKLLFVFIDSSQADHHRIMEFFGLAEGDLPALRIINLAEDMVKYKSDATELSSASVEKFANDFVSGNLKQHLMSEKTPTDWDTLPVKVLTGENFDSVALDPTKHVFVEFYAPWCGHCKSLAPIWDQLAERFAQFDNIVIAKLDSTANEVASVHVQSYPTLKFFAAGADKEPEDYSGARDLLHLSEFLMERTGVKVDVGASETDDFDDAHDEL